MIIRQVQSDSHDDFLLQAVTPNPHKHSSCGDVCFLVFSESGKRGLRRPCHDSQIDRKSGRRKKSAFSEVSLSGAGLLGWTIQAAVLANLGTRRSNFRNPRCRDGRNRTHGFTVSSPSPVGRRPSVVASPIFQVHFPSAPNLTASLCPMVRSLAPRGRSLVTSDPVR